MEKCHLWHAHKAKATVEIFQDIWNWLLITSLEKKSLDKRTISLSVLSSFQPSSLSSGFTLRVCRTSESSFAVTLKTNKTLSILDYLTIYLVALCFFFFFSRELHHCKIIHFKRSKKNKTKKNKPQTTNKALSIYWSTEYQGRNLASDKKKLHKYSLLLLWSVLLLLQDFFK